MTKRLLLIALLVTLLAGCATRPSPTIPTIAPRMERFIAEGQISGIVALVAKDGKVIHHEATGLADVDSRRPMRKDTMFWIASMTKPITATAVLMLQDEGKLSVSDPVSKYIPAFKDVKLKGGGAPARPLTLRDLLTHTSGVTGPGGVSETAPLADVADNIASSPLDFEPGAQWKYGNGLTVCGRVIEIVSGMAYEDFLHERIFKPVGMKDTTFHPSAAQRARLATLYKPGNEKGALEAAVAWFVSYDPAVRKTPNPSGGLASTTSDLIRFYQMILNGGELDGKRIISADAVRQMTSLQTGDLVTGFTPGNGWGLGWCIVREPQGVTASLSPGTFGHGGAFGTQGWIDPTRRMVFVMLIQRTSFGNGDASDIRKAFQELAVEAVK